MSFLMVILCAGGCSDDDDEKGGGSVAVNEENLIGTWEVTRYEGWTMYDGEKESFSEDDNTYRIEFRSDGTAQSWTYEGKWIEDDFSITEWYFKGNDLYTYDTEGDWEMVTVIELTRSKLVVESYSSDGTEYFKETYRRID